MDAIAARFRANVDDGVADAGSFGVEDLILFADTEREYIDQRIRRITFFKDAFAADRRHAETISVVRDATHNTSDDTAIVRGLRRSRHRTKAQRIHYGNGPRTHRKNVAKDTADPRCSALKRFDVAGMIVRFDLKSDDPAAANANDAGILTRPLHHVLALSGKLLQVDAGTLVGAVFAPHHAEDAEFGITGLAAEQSDDLLVLRGGELVLFDQLGRNFHEST